MKSDYDNMMIQTAKDEYLFLETNQYSVYSAECWF